MSRDWEVGRLGWGAYGKKDVAYSVNEKDSLTGDVEMDDNGESSTASSGGVGR